MRIRQFAAALALGAAAVALSACAEQINTTVSRYQAMPAPQGQTFFVVPGGGMAQQWRPRIPALRRDRRSAARRRAASRPATNAQSANMIVQFGYGVDRGQVRYVERSGFFGPASAMAASAGRLRLLPSALRLGLRRRLSAGAGTIPSGMAAEIDSYVEYHSQIDLHIRAAGTNAPLFDGRAQARSETNRLDVVDPEPGRRDVHRLPGTQRRDGEDHHPDHGRRRG